MPDNNFIHKEAIINQGKNIIAIVFIEPIGNKSILVVIAMNS